MTGLGPGSAPRLALGWLVWFAATWVVVVTATHFELPDLAQRVDLPPTLLTQWGGVALAFVPLPHAYLLTRDVPWLVAVTPRRRTTLHAIRIAMHLCLSALGMTTVLTILGPTVASGQLAALWLAYWGLTLVGLAARGRPGGVTPTVVAIFMSVPGLVPWDYNIAYNDTLSAPRTATGLMLMGIGLIAAVTRPRSL